MLSDSPTDIFLLPMSKMYRNRYQRAVRKTGYRDVKGGSRRQRCCAGPVAWAAKLQGFVTHVTILSYSKPKQTRRLKGPETALRGDIHAPRNRVAIRRSVDPVCR